MKEKISPIQKTLNVWAIILIVWAFYRAKLQMPIWFDEFIAKPLVFVLPVYYYIIRQEKQRFFQGIDFYPKKIGSDLITGLIIGIGFLITAIISLRFRNSQIGGLFPAQIFTTAITGFAASLSEEILSRGFILKRLYQDSKNKISASFFASILYFFLHIPILFTNAKITSNLLVVFMTIELIFSFINSIVFLNFGLALPILIHFFYYLSLSIVIS